MKSRIPQLPKSTRNVDMGVYQFETNKALIAAIEQELKKRGLTKRQAGEFGLKAFLLAMNPQEAARLGIKEQD